MRGTCWPVLLCTIPVYGQVWTQLPDFPGTARDDAASFGSWLQVFVGTGMDAGFQLTNDWYVYNPDGSWQPVAALPASGRQYCNGFTLTDERWGYLFGGLDGTGPLNELWRYDTFLDTWAPMAPLPAPGRYASAVIVSGDRAFVCGGLLAGGVATNDVWRYDLATDAWSAVAPLPGPARHRSAAMDLMVIGGADTTYQALNDVYRYDPDADSWQQLEDLPAPRYGAKCADRYLFCGASSPTLFHEDVFAFQAGTWSSSVLPTFEGGPRKGGVAAVLSVTSESWSVLFGLGTDGAARHTDWWMVEFYTGVEEHAARTTTVFPDPASNEVTPVLPANWPGGPFIVHDATGRAVLNGTLLNGLPIDVRHLAPGRYTLRTEHAGRSLRAPFIKLP